MLDVGCGNNLLARFFFWIGGWTVYALSPTERLQNISGSSICRYLKLLRKKWKPAALKMLLLLTCRLSWNIFMNRIGCCLPSIKSLAPGGSTPCLRAQ